MKYLLNILAAFLIILGLAALTLPFAVFTSPRELNTLAVILACLVCVISIGLGVSGLQYFRKKDKDSALAVATTSGFLLWMILNSQAMQLVEDQEAEVWKFGALVLPILICYYGTKAFKSSIRQKYQKGA